MTVMERQASQSLAKTGYGIIFLLNDRFQGRDQFEGGMPRALSTFYFTLFLRAITFESF